MSKEEKELQKLDLEIQALKKPWYLKAANLFSFVGLVLAIVGVLLQGSISKIEKLQAEEARDEAKKQEAETKEKIRLLNDELAILNEKSSRIRIEEKKLFEVSKSIEPVTPMPTGPKYITDVWAFGVKESAVNVVKKYLLDKGYEVGFGGLLSSRPSWLALSSTVFFYHSDSESVAIKIADDLLNETGITFKVQRGAGLGVAKDEKKETFFVHVVH